MMAQFRDIALVQRDGAAARRLRDRFLTFLPEEQAHVPILEALYAYGWRVGEDGTLVS